MVPREVECYLNDQRVPCKCLEHSNGLEPPYVRMYLFVWMVIISGAVAHYIHYFRGCRFKHFN